VRKRKAVLDGLLLALFAKAAWTLTAVCYQLLAGGLGHFARIAEAGGFSAVPSVRMWRLHLPVTITACLLTTLVGWLIRRQRTNVRTGEVLGELVGVALGLLLFASPLPGWPWAMWSAIHEVVRWPTVVLIRFWPYPLLSGVVFGIAWVSGWLGPALTTVTLVATMSFLGRYLVAVFSPPGNGLGTSVVGQAAQQADAADEARRSCR